MKFLGVSDDITTCEKCGKPNLKRTITIELDNGTIVHYGCDCAARMIKGSNVRAVNTDADVIAYAQKWLQVYRPDVVCKGIWNKFGYLCEVREGHIRIKTSAGITSL